VNQLNADAMETFKECLMGVIIVPLVIPWGYVLRNYVLKRGDRWGYGTRRSSSKSALLSLPM